MTSKKWITALVLSTVAAGSLMTVSAVAKGQGGMMERMMGQERPSFTELDTDGDGQLSVAEIKAIGDARFASMDTNGDGMITADEASAHAAGMASKRAGKMFERMIQWRDANGDGGLSQAEMGDNGPEKMFMRADGDGDGMISAEEYEQGHQRGPRGGKGERGKMGGHGNMGGHGEGEGKMGGHGEGHNHGG